MKHTVTVQTQGCFQYSTRRISATRIMLFLSAATRIKWTEFRTNSFEYDS